MLEVQKDNMANDGGLTTVPSLVARLLIEELSKNSNAYCILTGYDDLPESFDSDIDFMVGAQDFERVPEWIAFIAQQTGTRLFQVIPHEATARAFRLAHLTADGTTFIQPDSCSDYRHFGKLWLKSDEVLEARRPHPKGFWIPAARHEFLYYLIKRLNKRDFRQEHGIRLSRLYSEDPANCDVLLRRFWTEDTAQRISKMAGTGDWRPLIQKTGLFKEEMLQHPAEGWKGRAISRWRNLTHTFERIIQPTGGWIVFVGPDGCGKSSVIEAVIREFGPAFQQIVRCHMRPGIFPGRIKPGSVVTDPHGKPSRSGLASAAKMLYLAFDYFLGHFMRVLPAMMRTKLVIFDRYFYDILVDPKRVRYGGPRWLLRWIAVMLPKPDLVILLNASPEVLWSRKQEVPFEEVCRQQKMYLELAVKLKHAVVIDAAQPLSDVVHDTAEAIVSCYSKRARIRLGLGEGAEA
ncbi:MAG TPA: dTMP kinase [Pseudacidobacterium sp.]|nr:dTMP kinase [Pseudacidobacterium sp.]